MRENLPKEFVADELQPSKSESGGNTRMGMRR